MLFSNNIRLCEKNVSKPLKLFQENEFTFKMITFYTYLLILFGFSLKKLLDAFRNWKYKHHFNFIQIYNNK